MELDPDRDILLIQHQMIYTYLNQKNYHWEKVQKLDYYLQKFLQETVLKFFDHHHQ